MSQLKDFRIEDNKALLGAIIKPREPNVPAHIFWDPILSDGVDLKCSLHNSSLTRTGKMTTEKGRDQTRTIWHVGTNCILVSALYNCKMCGHDSKHLAHDENITQQLPSSVVIPFEIFHRSAATKDLIELIFGGIKSGK